MIYALRRWGRGVLLNLGVSMDIEGLYGGKKVVNMLHCYFTAAGGTMHECKATCKYAFQDNNCV